MNKLLRDALVANPLEGLSRPLPISKTESQPHVPPEGYTEAESSQTTPKPSKNPFALARLALEKPGNHLANSRSLYQDFERSVDWYLG